jgi:alpha-tubulin suppressor-like RCC1 family protein
MMTAAAGADAAASEAAGQLESEVVADVAASKYFSLCLTAKGEVWTFGGSNDLYACSDHGMRSI